MITRDGLLPIIISSILNRRYLKISYRSRAENIFRVKFLSQVLAGKARVSRGGFRQVQKVHIQGRIQAGSKGSHKPVKQFRFLKQNIKINYQIPDYKKNVKLSKFLKKLNESLLQHFLFPLHRLSCIFGARTEHNSMQPVLFTSWLEDAPELSS